MSRWDDLFVRYQRAEISRRDALRQQAEAEAERRKFEEWAYTTIPRLFDDLATIAVERAEALRQHTGVLVTVSGPRGAPVDTKRPWLAYLNLVLGESRVSIYATGAPHSCFYVHTLTNSLDFGARVVTRHGAMITRREDDAYELRYLIDDPHGPAHAVMPLDTFVFRAFEQLAEADAEQAMHPRRSRHP